MDPVVHHSNELSIRFHISVRMDSLSATCPDVLWGRVQTEVHFHVAGMWLYGSGEGFFSFVYGILVVWLKVPGRRTRKPVDASRRYGRI